MMNNSMRSISAAAEDLSMNEMSLFSGFEILIQNIVRENNIKQSLIARKRLQAAELEKDSTEKEERIRLLKGQIGNKEEQNRQLMQSTMLRQSNIDMLRQHLKLLEEHESSLKRQLTIKKLETKRRKETLEVLTRKALDTRNEQEALYKEMPAIVQINEIRHLLQDKVMLNSSQDVSSWGVADNEDSVTFSEGSDMHIEYEAKQGTSEEDNSGDREPVTMNEESTSTVEVISHNQTEHQERGESRKGETRDGMIASDSFIVNGNDPISELPSQKNQNGQSLGEYSAQGSALPPTRPLTQRSSSLQDSLFSREFLQNVQSPSESLQDVQRESLQNVWSPRDAVPSPKEVLHNVQPPKESIQNLRSQGESLQNTQSPKESLQNVQPPRESLQNVESPRKFPQNVGSPREFLHSPKAYNQNIQSHRESLQNTQAPKESNLRSKNTILLQSIAEQEENSPQKTNVSSEDHVLSKSFDGVSTKDIPKLNDPTPVKKKQVNNVLRNCDLEKHQSSIPNMHSSKKIFVRIPSVNKTQGLQSSASLEFCPPKVCTMQKMDCRSQNSPRPAVGCQMVRQEDDTLFHKKPMEVDFMEHDGEALTGIKIQDVSMYRNSNDQTATDRTQSECSDTSFCSPQTKHYESLFTDDSNPAMTSPCSNDGFSFFNGDCDADARSSTDAGNLENIFGFGNNEQDEAEINGEPSSVFARLFGNPCKTIGKQGEGDDSFLPLF